ncbi:MAG: hypothetical protein CSA15_04215 [Candidatus Delongbacteria bacterium]|nr:MAG: hypothetical protein CSA15_04215 [Candidatus Delongbacteria bacterium]
MFLYLLKYIKKYFLLLTILIFLIAVGLFLTLLEPMMLKFLVDDVIIAKDNSLLIKLLFICVDIILVKVFLKLIESYIYTYISSNVLFKIKYDLYKHLQNLPLSFFKENKTGELISRIETDVSVIQYFIISLFLGIVTDLGIAIITFVIIFLINSKLALLSLLVFPFLYLTTEYFGKIIKKYSKIYREKATNILVFFQEAFNGIRLIKINSNETLKLKELLKLGRELIKISICREMFSKFSYAILDLFNVLFPLLLLFYGASLVVKEDLTLGLLLAYYTYIGKLFKPFHRLARVNITIQNVKVSFERVLEYLNIKTELDFENNEKNNIDTIETIEFKNVSFSYKNNDRINLVLDNVSFKIESGKKIAFVGESGSGKSTIVDLILKLYRVDEGEILINGININDIDKKALRSIISSVPQEDFFFNGTIMENLLLVDSSASMDNIIKACKLANIYNYIEDLPDKFYTKIGEKGMLLSGGEKQRLSLARSFLKGSNFFILDEVTSQLDNKLEKNILNSYDNIQDITQIIIAHRLSFVKNSDKIYVLNKGKIIEEGDHKELIDYKGKYFELWNSQFK